MKIKKRSKRILLIAFTTALTACATEPRNPLPKQEVKPKEPVTCSCKTVIT